MTDLYIAATCDDIIATCCDIATRCCNTAATCHDVATCCWPIDLLTTSRTMVDFRPPKRRSVSEN